MDEIQSNRGGRKLTSTSFFFRYRRFILIIEDFAFDSIKKEALIILEEKKSSGIPIAIYEHPGTTHG